MNNVPQTDVRAKTAPPRPRRMTSAQRREQILDKACELFAKTGYDAVSTKELAAALDISEALIFQHFPTKESIYQTLFEEWEESEQEPVVIRLVGGSALKALEKWFSDMVTFRWQKANQRQNLYYAISSRPSFNGARLKVLSAAPDIVYDTLRPLLETGMQKGEFERQDSFKAAYTVWAMIRGILSIETSYPERYPRPDFELVRRLLQK